MTADALTHLATTLSQCKNYRLEKTCCLLKRLFRHRSKKTPKLRVTGLCEGNSPVTGEFPAQRASNAENVSIWWHHHALNLSGCLLKRLFRRRSKKTSKLRVTGLFEGNSPVTGEFPAQRVNNAENVSIWWHHHALNLSGCLLKRLFRRRSKKTSKLRVTGLFLGEFTGYRWIPRTKGQ